MCVCRFIYLHTHCLGDSRGCFRPRAIGDGNFKVYMYIYIRTHTHTHTHTHAYLMYIHMHIYVYIHTHPSTSRFTRVPPLKGLQSGMMVTFVTRAGAKTTKQIFIYIYIHTHRFKDSHGCRHSRAHSRECGSIYIHIYVHSNTHAHTHIYIYTHMHIESMYTYTPITLQIRRCRH